jgi:site-specific DNA-cytosine methylase
LITAKSYFSGAGGMDLGMIEAGIHILESYEIDSKAVGTLKNNFEHTTNQSDITQITVLDQQDADVYIGTFPCTRYNVNTLPFFKKYVNSRKRGDNESHCDDRSSSIAIFSLHTIL